MTLVDETVSSAQPNAKSSAQPNAKTRVAGVLGDPRGSYELLIASRICAALGVDAGDRPQLVATSSVSPGTVTWLRGVAAKATPDAERAAEVLTALQLDSATASA